MMGSLGPQGAQSTPSLLGLSGAPLRVERGSSFYDGVPGAPGPLGPQGAQSTPSLLGLSGPPLRVERGSSFYGGVPGAQMAPSLQGSRVVPLGVGRVLLRVEGGGVVLGQG